MNCVPLFDVSCLLFVVCCFDDLMIFNKLVERERGREERRREDRNKKDGNQ
jgi:hypothetical protein